MQQVFRERDVAAALGVRSAQYLGTGSFGETWRVDGPTGAEAIKIIHADGYDPERLRREIVGYERVSSPYVVELLRPLTLQVSGKTRAAMAFRFVPGGDLSQMLEVRRPGPDELRELAAGLLRGVKAMHAAGLLHRDLKPANVALADGAYEHPVVLDLGLTKLLDVESMTKYPSHIGTFTYMAPEQLRGERAFRASDLWAVGVILHEAGLGKHPFLDRTERVTLEELLARTERPLDFTGGTVPDEVELLIRRCLSPQAYRRGTVARALGLLEGSGNE